MFSKILIANRGEIAVRVIRTCRELDIPTVAVYSELDAGALHTQMADEAHSLGGKTAAESYLNTEAILNIIGESGADAVHPGYGFYSENADFVNQLTAAGVTFIGPPPEAIEVMGDKLSARKAAERAGVSGVPGTSDSVTSPKEVEDFTAQHGWPIAIKAAYGGGGRGMKMLAKGDDIQAALESAARESLAYFGREELYIERYLEWPRHIEVQLLGDQHGSFVYFGTRDCSLQRRHQKLIEEAPAPDVDPKILDKMGEAAVSIAKECSYTNAGTVEFLFEDGEFYFLEMNTRLQVEHPATEVIVGMDLVAEQIRVAAGEKLGYAQKDIQINGHAIEVRINAEDPAAGAFLPSPGKISTLKIPNGFATRFDGGYEAGGAISEYYDNLVGKLICWGKDRDTAIARTIRALAEMEIGPIATTIPADIAMLSHADFKDVKHSTRWVEDNLDLSHIAPQPPAASDLDDGAQDQKTLEVEVNGRRYQVVLHGDDFGGLGAGAQTARRKKPQRRQSSGATGSSGAAAGGGDVAVPMQGTIVKVLVEAGDKVEKDDPIVILETMKMENNVNSPTSGTVEEILVAEGDTVGTGDIVAKIA